MERSRRVALVDEERVAIAWLLHVMTSAATDV